MVSETTSFLLIGLAVGLTLLIIIGIIINLIRRKYSLNWYQKTALEDLEGRKQSSGSLQVVRHHISSHNQSDESSDDDSEQDRCALLGEDNSPQTSPTLLGKLSKHVGFIQPPVSEGSTSATAMGAEDSKLSPIKPILKAQKSDGNRRFSAPVVSGKAGSDGRRVPVLSVIRRKLGLELSGHAKLSSTRSAPYGQAVTQIDEKSLAMPLAAADEKDRAKHARRRLSMQDTIDATSFNPSLYSLERTPTIKEESSVDISEPIGILFLTIHLDTDTGLLKVTIHKADLTGFPTSQLQLRTPYFTVFVIGSNSPTRQTRHSANDQNPEIEETFLFEVGDDLTGERLICHLYDFDQFVKTEKLGTVQLRLNTVPQNELFSLQKHIDRCPADDHDHDENYAGELLFSLRCNKAKDLLTLVIAKAKDLHIEDEIAVIGLMVKVTVLDQGRRCKRKRTDNVKVGTSPSFSQAVTINVIPPRQVQDLSIILDVCKVRLSTTEAIGRVYIGPDSGPREVEHWKEFQESSTHDTSLEWWHHLKRVDRGT